jgi:hypothetical protein
VASEGDAVIMFEHAWVAPVGIEPGTGLPTSVSCSNANTCFAVDTSGFLYEFFGSSWSAVSTSSMELNAISCVPNLCQAVGDNGVIMTLKGPTWSPVVTHVGSQEFASVSCVNSSYCLAGTASGFATFFTGSKWGGLVSKDIYKGRGFTSVACTTGPLCAMSDATGHIIYLDNGVQWNKFADQVGGMILGSACTPNLICWSGDARGFVVKFTKSSRSTWTSPVQLDNASITSMSCPTSFFCGAVDTLGRFYYWFGGKWSAGTLVSFSPLISLSCTPTGSCVALDQGGQIHRAKITG